MDYYLPYYRLVSVSMIMLIGLSVGVTPAAGAVENTVSVTANSSGGTGSSVMHSQTIVNGTVVEDVTKTGSGAIEYHNVFHTDGQTVVATATARTASSVVPLSPEATSSDARATLQALVIKLRHYVSLLTALLAATQPAA